jgi:hypothetical protein
MRRLRIEWIPRSLLVLVLQQPHCARSASLTAVVPLTSSVTRFRLRERVFCFCRLDPGLPPHEMETQPSSASISSAAEQFEGLRVPNLAC